MVGREPEVAAAQGLLDAIALGDAAVLMITGDLGVGKTRLAEEIGMRAHQRGQLVRWGRALGADVSPARGTIREALESLQREQPLVVVLEDLHWTDLGSLQLLSRVLRHMPESGARGVLIVITCRTGRSPPTLEWSLEPVAAAGILTRMELAALLPADAERLVPRRIAPRLREEIARESAGNPLFTLALAGGVKAGGTVPEELPSDVLAAIAEDLNSLSPRARGVLEAAAVIGDPFQPQLSRAIANLDAQDAAEGLRELVERGLLRAPGRWHRYLVFRAPILRRAVYNATGLAARQEAHRRVARLMEERSGLLTARADHAARGGGYERRDIAVLLQAAESASADEPQTSARWFADALRRMADDDKRRAAALVGATNSLVAAGRMSEADELFAEAVGVIGGQRLDSASTLASFARVEAFLGAAGPSRALLRRELEHAPDERSAAILGTALSVAHWRVGDTDQMTRAAHEAVRAARACGDADVRMRAATVLGLTTSMDGQTVRARFAVDEAERLTQVLPDPALSGHLEFLLLLTHVNHGLERYAAAARHIERGIRLSESRHAYLRVACGVAQGWIQFATGRLHEAGRTADEMLASASSLGSEQLLMRAHTLRAMAAVGAGQPAVAVKAAEEATRAADAVPSGFTTVGARCLLGIVRAEAGDHHGGPQLILQHGGGAELPRLEDGLRPECYATLARSARLAGDRTGAEAWTSRAEQSAARLVLSGRTAAARAARARLLLETDPRRAARMALEAAREYGSVGRLADHGRAVGLVGQAQARSGDTRQAVATLESAHAVLAECGAERSRDVVARTLRELGHPTPRPPERGSAGAGVEALSGREREVAELVAKGLTNKRIADEMFVSSKTVEDHLARAFAKLGVSSRAALAAAVAGAGRLSH